MCLLYLWCFHVCSPTGFGGLFFVCRPFVALFKVLFPLFPIGHARYFCRYSIRVLFTWELNFVEYFTPFSFNIISLLVRVYTILNYHYVNQIRSVYASRITSCSISTSPLPSCTVFITRTDVVTIAIKSKNWCAAQKNMASAKHKEVCQKSVQHITMENTTITPLNSTLLIIP